MKRRKSIIKSLITILLVSLMSIGIFGNTLLANEVDGVKADPGTQDTWNNFAKDSTEYIGRIWTDKSVSEDSFSLTGTLDGTTVTKDKDSDFLVMLSALSTASSTATTNSTPLDIVLVLDVSGSMDEEIAETVVSYEEYDNDWTRIYDAYRDRNNLYYSTNGEDYVKVNIEERGGWWNTTYTISAQGVQSVSNLSGNDRIPYPYAGNLYLRSETTVPGSTQPKIDALKDSVNNFIDLTAEANNTMPSGEGHRVSIVKFADDSFYRPTSYNPWTGYEYDGEEEKDKVGNDLNPVSRNYNFTQVMRDFTEVTTSNASQVKQTVNSIDPAGATSADYGFELANDVLNGTGNLEGARENAKKVVIFFTDGEPNHSNDFSKTVADAAIANSKSLKDSGAIVYSIGVFSGADPSDTQSNFNKYMNAVSSNYPDAQNMDDIGNRAEDADDKQYYKAATSTSSLEQVFEDIFSQISAGSGSPTLVEEGAEHKSGYITFNDKLGKYMHVTRFTEIIYANTEFTNVSSTVSGNVETYVFEGIVDGNNIYGEANLGNIIIEVDRTDPNQDMVTVKIPASLIPLRYFDVTDENGEYSMTIKEAYPIRIFYEVALDDNIRTAVENGTFANSDKAYLDANTNENGEVLFYANEFDRENKEYGTVYADFKPSTANQFYYFTANTPLYTDPQATIPARGSIDPDTTYYYVRTYYYKDNNGQIVKEDKVVKATNINANAGVVVDGQLNVRGGTRKNLSDYDDANIEYLKNPNTTDTANYVISPTWSGDSIHARLGNNGYIPLAVPGSLEVSKTVEKAAGFEGAYTGHENDTFEFTLTLTGATKDSYQVNKVNADGTDQMITLNKEDYDTYKFSLKDGESIEILGLEAGVIYNLNEKDHPNYEEGTISNATGVIAAATKATASVTNTFKVGPTTLPVDHELDVRKLFTGRDTTANDTFEFAIRLVETTPSTNVDGVRFVDGDGERDLVTITMKDETYNGTDPIESENASFGDIEFSKPGTYTFSIMENDGNKPGIYYSGETYYMVVEVVVDAQSNTLKVNSIKYYKGSVSDQTEYDYETAGAFEFTNSYNAKEATFNLVGRKELKVTNSDKTLKANDFKFKITAVRVDGTTYTTDQELADNVPMPTLNGQTVKLGQEVGNGENTLINFGTITFESHTVNKEYTYVIQEVVPAADGNGYTYDDETKELTIQVREDTSDGVHLVAEAVNDLDPAEDRPNSYFLFTNSYEPESYTTSDDTNDTLKVEKTLNGRDWHNDTFTFTLVAKDNAPKPASGTVITITRTTETDGTKLSETFGSITYEKAGTYNYTIKETAGDNKGITYDNHEVNVQVVVVDENGSLKVQSISYDGDASDTAAASFVNTYKATGTATITVQKTIDGRDFIPEDDKNFNGGFIFTLASKDDYGDSVTMPASEELVKTVTFHDQSTGLSSNQRRDTFAPITFNKAGEYTFTVGEKVNDIPIPGITYDTEVKEVTFVVEDNYDGSLKVTVNGEEKDNALVEVTNTYEPDDVTTSEDTDTLIDVTKVIDGRDWLDGEEFTFTIEPSNETPDAPLPAATEITIAKGQEANRNSASFGSVTYSDDGTYKYIVKETVGDESKGLTYSKGEYEVVVEVTDNTTEGKLEVSKITYNIIKGINGEAVSGQASSIRFTNTYKASGTYELKVHKNFVGRENDKWLDTDSFDFTLKPNGTETEEAIANNEILLENEELTIDSNTADKTATFGNITFNKVGDYSFVIAEEKPEIGYITYADDQTVDFKVTDENNDGTLTVQATVNGAEVANNTLKFVNTYTADATTAVITVNKTLDGKDWFEGDAFTFTLAADEEDNNTTAAVTNDDVVLPETTELTISYNEEDNYTASFGEITFKKEGTYKFTVTEGGLKGNWSNENSVQTVTITVNDDDEGHLVVDGTSVTTVNFTNKFTPDSESVNIQGTKVMQGREFENDDIFEFTLTSIDNAPMPADATGATKVVENKGAVIDFGTISYDHADEYKYQITEEVINDVDGITSDPNPVDVIVTVTYDEKTGDLTPTVTYSRYNETNDGFLFTNTYEADPVTIESVVSTGLTGKKEITNADAENEYVLGAGDFSFTLTPADTNNEYDPIKDGVNVTNGEDGTFTVIAKETEYTTVGEYIYYLSEDDTTIDGITKDTSEYTITVSITDEGHDGQLDAAVKVEKDGQTADAIVFDNTFDASKVSPAQIEATKTLSGKELTDGEFEFELSTSAENGYTLEGADASGKVVVKNTAAAESNVKFPAITFDKAGTYEYTITEVNSGKTGYVYDGSVYVITYEVELDPDTNKLNVNGTLTKDGVPADVIIFENTYDPNDVVLSSDTDSAIKAHKTLDGRELAADEFTFGLYEVNGAEETLVEEVTNDANGDVVFSDLTFDTVGTYNYVIKENGAGTTNNGITYHKDPISVTVTITDEGFDGQLDAEVVYNTESNTAEFTNTYSASAVTDLVLPVKKVLTNRELAEGEFTFELYQDGKLVETVKNDANGDVRFSGLTFDKVGETTYIVKEVKGNDKTITYDDTEYEIKVSVTDNQKGRLEAKVEVLNDKDDDGIVTFENTYTEPEILVPDTAGDNHHLMIYLSLSAAVVCGIAIVVVLKKKENLGK